jgi:phosphate starvation-inducible PhoH-like protein
VSEKIDPYFVPMREALEARLGKGQVEYMLKFKQLEFVPFALMRGRTFDDAFVILDEAQNTTIPQMKMFLTRAGTGSKLVVNGDLLQSDIPGPSGLKDAVERFRGRPGVGMTVFKREDVVRSGLAKLAVEVYEDDDSREQTEVLGKLPGFITGNKDQLDLPLT